MKSISHSGRPTVVISLLGLAIEPLALQGHGPQIQIGVTNNQIVTHGLFLNEPYQNPTAGQRVYKVPMVQRSLSDPNDGWYTEFDHVVAPYAGPGLALIDNNFATGSILTVKYLEGLKIWNGSGFVDPGTEQIAAATSSTFATPILTTDTSPFNSLNLAAATGASNDHKTIRWRLLGDGISPDTSSDDGIYLLSLQVSTNQTGIAASLPYYFLLNKNASDGDAALALAYVNANLVPEPATICPLACAGLFMLFKKKMGSGVRGQSGRSALERIASLPFQLL